jgi:tetratricopeptide (TPR) repeat protein
LAQNQFERILLINPNYPLVNYFLGQSFLLSKDYNAAIEQAKEERSKNSQLPHSYTLAAEAYYRMGQYSLCAREYQEAIRREPQGGMSYVKVSTCYRLSGNLEIAMQMLTKATQIESGISEIYKEMGAIYETKGESLLAIKSYEKYLALEPTAKDRNQIESRMRQLGGK